MPLRPITREEIPTLAELFGRSFRYDSTISAERLSGGQSRYSYDNGYIWEDEARGAVAGMAMFERPVSLNGGELEAGLIASVSVPPEQRRRGYANAMMRGGLEQLHARQRPLSLLFPYSIPFYNRLGYGIVSNVWLLEFPLAQMMDFDELRLTRCLQHEDMPAMARLYERERLRHNGWLARTEWEWRERVLDLPGHNAWPQRVEGIAVPGEGDELHGYLTYTLAHVSESSRDRVLTIREWVSDSTRPEAWRALAGFVAAQRAQAEFVRYTAPQGFPLLHAMRERWTFRDRRDVDFAFRDTLMQGAGLMGRIVHLEQALVQRRYPAQVQGECIVRMVDPQLPANEVPLHLSIAGGDATCQPVSGGDAIYRGGDAIYRVATADARTWAELYAAALSPADAYRLGRLESDADTIAFLTAAFACEPWFLHQADWF